MTRKLLTTLTHLFVAVVLAAVFVVLFHSLPAAAQMACGNRAVMTRTLAMQYGETRQGGVLPGSTMPIELWASKATGSWTILKSHAGKVCIMAAGNNWQTDVPEISGAPV